MLKIRLARIGKKKKPMYRFIVSENTKDTFGKALEILGHYNPFTKVTEVNKDRILYWISKGAKLSPTVNNMLIDQNVVSGQKVKASKAKQKKKAGEEPAAPAAKVEEASVAAVEPKIEAAAPVEEAVAVKEEPKTDEPKPEASGS
ncbi:MAG: 30S ribosomal protein S16 [Patescibacteria group bacterium]|jgi:small subunit ribosomal protein S16|nr:30S ribosomal protein S16 [Patescibacteria group bacterium]